MQHVGMDRSEHHNHMASWPSWPNKLAHLQVLLHQKASGIGAQT